MPRADGYVQIRVYGDRELIRKLESIEHRLPEEVRSIGGDVADMIAIYAKRKVPTGPGRNGHVRSSLRGELAGVTPIVKGGGPSFPYYGWLEFGGHVGINRSVAREKIPDGRYIVPTVRERRHEIEDQMSHGLQELCDRHGIVVT